MIPARHLVKELLELDSRLRVVWNPVSERFEVRLQLTEAEWNLEGIEPLEAIDHGKFSGGRLIELVPRTVLIKKVEMASGAFYPFDRSVVEYIKFMDTHRFDSVDQWMDSVEREGRARLKNTKRRHQAERIHAVKADWNSATLHRRISTPGVTV